MPKIVENKNYWCLICPATEDVLLIPKDGGWTYNGDADKPTFSPSINMQSGKDFGEKNHFFIRDGMIQYLSDCTHSMRSSTVEIEPFPEDRIRYYEDDKE